MLPFDIDFKRGRPAAEQVLFAVKKAMVTGQLREGDAFPSVRQLSQDLRINPNTAHKVVSTLIQENLLRSEPGVGTFIKKVPPSTAAQKARLLETEVEKLIVEAKKVQIELSDLVVAVKDKWKQLKEVKR